MTIKYLDASKLTTREKEEFGIEADIGIFAINTDNNNKANKVKKGTKVYEI